MWLPVTCLKTVFFCLRWCLGVQVNKTLQTLNIGWNKIGPEGAASLAEALKVLAHSMASLYGLSVCETLVCPLMSLFGYTLTPHCAAVCALIARISCRLARLLAFPSSLR